MNAVKVAHEKGYRTTPEGQVIGLRGYVLSPIRRSSGYYTFSIRVGGQQYGVPIHRLVAYEKYGEAMFAPGIEVRHLDGDPRNNAWDNIAIGTHRENMNDRPRHQIRKHALAAGRSRSPLTAEHVHDIRRLRTEGWTYRRITEKYGIAKSTVSYIVNRKTWVEV